MAAGLFDPDSPIRVRIVHAGKPRAIDLEFWRARFEQALAVRSGLFDDRTNGWRAVNGESDGFPGLVLDRYDTALVLKLYSAAWLPRLEEISGIIAGALPADRIVLRLSRNIQPAFARSSRADGDMLKGDAPPSPVVFLESGLQFEADVLRGQKTGFFLDQRENRRLVESLSSGCSVLNAFSFTGGFSLYAARGGATSVTNLDVSAHALAGAERNFRLNASAPGVARCAREGVRADAFEWLASAPQKFDLIILDPPSLAKRESERAGAVHAYERLAMLAIARLNRPGILVSASCSAHVNADEFFHAVLGAAAKSGCKFNELHRAFHAPDHPARFKEMEYLKSIYINVAS